MINLSAWLATYILHSTLFVLAVYGITRFMGQKQLRLQNTLWKTAVFAGLFTASLQSSGVVTPFAGSLPVPFLTEHTSSAPEEIFTNSYSAVHFSNSAINGTQIHFQQRNRIVQQVPAINTVPTSYFNWFLFIWLLGTIYGLTRLTMYQVRLRQLSRSPVKDFTILAAFQNIRNSAGVSRHILLTQSADISSPLVLSGSEICLPTRVIDDMPPHQQRSVLAHELSHVIRKDPLWFLTLAILETVLFFQPLNRLARKQIRILTEYSCDDWAIGKTGRSIDLARCLASVASWTKPHSIASHVPAMANGALKKRVSRILDSNTSRTNLPMITSLSIVAMFTMLLCFTAPSFEAPLATKEAAYHISTVTSKSEVTFLRGNVLQTQTEQRLMIYVPQKVDEEPTLPTKIIWH